MILGSPFAVKCLVVQKEIAALLLIGVIWCEEAGAGVISLHTMILEIDLSGRLNWESDVVDYQPNRTRFYVDIRGYDMRDIAQVDEILVIF